MSKSKIEWTDKVWNPVTGCGKVSDGCKNCYAERMFSRANTVKEIPTDDRFNGVAGAGYRKRKFTDIICHAERLERPLHWKKPCMVFVNSMSDLFHEDISFEFLWEIHQIFQVAKQHTYQVLTKRPRNIIGFLEWFTNRYRNIDAPKLNYKYPEQVWLGVSVENQKTADERIPVLLQIPAKIRWVSVEPMLEFIALGSWLLRKNIDWVVIGAESGSKRRECKIGWIMHIVNMCNIHNIPVFVKQIHLNGKLENNINKFPKELQVREYPNV